MEQEKLAEMIKSLIEKDKENFVKKEGIVETKNYKTGKEVSVNKKINIDFDNNYLQEIHFKNVEVETEEALLIKTLCGNVWVNKKHCYKSKKYQFKPVFLIKVFNDLNYKVINLINPDEPASIKGANIKW